MMKSFLKFYGIIFLALLGSMQVFATNGKTKPLSQFDDWESYVNEYRHLMQDYLKPSTLRLSRLVPAFEQGAFVFRRNTGGLNYFTSTNTTTTQVFGIFPKPNYYTLNRPSYGYTGEYINNWSDYHPIWTSPETNPVYGNAKFKDYDREEWYDLGEDYYCKGKESYFCEKQLWEEKTEVTKTEKRKAVETKLKFTPMAFFDAMWTSKIINQDQIRNAPYIISQDIDKKLNLPFKKIKLTDESTSGYLVNKKQVMSLGGGGAIGIHTYNTNGIMGYLGPYIGILPITSSDIEYTVWVKTKEEADKVKLKRLPQKAQDLLNWKIGEEVRYRVTGMVNISIGINALGIFSAGLATITNTTKDLSQEFKDGIERMNLDIKKAMEVDNAVIDGDYEITVKKIDDQKVYVNYKVLRMKNASLYMGPLLMTASYTHNLQHLEEGLSFMMDISKPKVKSAFNELLRGDIKLAQGMAFDKENASVIPIYTNKLFTEGELSNIGISIPLIAHVSGTEGQVKQVSRSFFHPDQSKTDAYQEIYMDVISRNFFGIRSEVGQVFYATAFENTTSDQKVKKGHFANILFYAEKTDAGVQTLNKTLTNMIAQTGLANELALEFEDVEKKSGAGHVKMELNINLNQNVGDTLVHLNSINYREDIFNSIAKGFIESYFSDRKDKKPNRDPHKICCMYNNDKRKNENYRTCYYRYQRKTLKAIEEMVDALKLMTRYKYDFTKKEYIKAYTQFGKAMLSNQFTFQTILNLVKGRGVDISFSAQGENIPQYNHKIQVIPEIK